ncbi:substrate-binding domain-containing protein [Actinoplanes sp. NBRC 103695]|uniref:sugar ABC transporter substrate-binding protein n=1 Tax=Actinoplanes sp. NBRC 103695 TaxID=3032202 RepID=UPI00255647FF|nr:substrate-binding domain-containing protein [Actinoplanes sp. NBRC 103695]
MNGILAIAGLGGCSDDNDADPVGRTESAARVKIGVIMPDTTSSQRWASQDTPYLKEAFAAAGVPSDIRNAEGDRAQFERIADDMIAGGASVLIIVSQDSPTGKAVLDKAKAAGVRTIDYDRLTLNGGADYHVSFDNEAVGRLQAVGLKKCLNAKQYRNPVVATLNGSPTDNNATLFKDGYESILQPLYDRAEYTKGPDQWVKDWNEGEATAVFDQMLTQQPLIRGVLAANDGLADATIGVLKSQGLNGSVPVTGQDATVSGLQNILTGDQCMTVFKDIKPEAEQAAALAVALHRGERPVVKELLKDPESGAFVPFVKLEPTAITRANIKHVFDVGFADRAEVCSAKYVRLCRQAGI